MFRPEEYLKQIKDAEKSHDVEELRELVTGIKIGENIEADFDSNDFAEILMLKNDQDRREALIQRVESEKKEKEFNDNFVDYILDFFKDKDQAPQGFDFRQDGDSWEITMRSGRSGGGGKVTMKEISGSFEDGTSLSDNTQANFIKRVIQKRKEDFLSLVDEEDLPEGWEAKSFSANNLRDIFADTDYAIHHSNPQTQKGLRTLFFDLGMTKLVMTMKDGSVDNIDLTK